MHVNGYLSGVWEQINIICIICYAKYCFGSCTIRHLNGFLKRIIVENISSTVRGITQFFCAVFFLDHLTLPFLFSEP